MEKYSKLQVDDGEEEEEVIAPNNELKLIK